MKGNRIIGYRLLLIGLVVLPFLSLIMNEGIQAQVTRSQVNLQFMRAEMLLRREKYQEALSALDVVIEISPGYPAPYLRKAHIYDDLYKRNGDQEVLASSIYYYRKYLTLEYDDEKVLEPSKRLRQLEDILKISHFEDLEEQDSRKELTRQDAAPVVTSDEEAKAAAGTLSISQKPVEEVILNPYHGFNFARHYGVELPQAAVTRPNPVVTDQDLSGHWVSDVCIEDGREMWNFKFAKSSNGNYIITISDQSGIVNPSRERKAIQKQAMSYMRRVRLLNDMRYVIVNEEAEGKTKGNEISFMFAIDEEFVQGKTLSKWAHNVMSNIAHLVSSDNSDAYFADQSNVKAITVEYTFDCKLVTPNVMECNLSNLRNTVNPNGYMRTRRGQDQKIYLHRTSRDYTFYEMPEVIAQQNNAKAEALFAQVNEDAKTQNSKRFPLAILHQYGIGVKQNEDKAIQMITQLATSAGDPIAKAMLANYYFHEAYDEEEHSTTTRRKYLKSSEYWMQSLHRQDDARWYGIKGDMFVRANAVSWDERADLFSSLTTSMVDSAASYYRQGAQKGDVRSMQRLGHLFLYCIPEKRNLEEATMWLNMASDAGNAEAELDLGHYFWLKEDYNAYIKHTARAAEMGCPEAFEELSKAYCCANGRFYGLDYDFEKAILFKQLALQADYDSWIPILVSYGYKVTE